MTTSVFMGASSAYRACPRPPGAEAGSHVFFRRRVASEGAAVFHRSSAWDLTDMPLPGNRKKFWSLPANRDECGHGPAPDDCLPVPGSTQTRDVPGPGVPDEGLRCYRLPGCGWLSRRCRASSVRERTPSLA